MTRDIFDVTTVKPSHWNLASVIEQLRVSREATHNIRHHGKVRELPSRDRKSVV